jgi:hypothetical protein
MRLFLLILFFILWPFAFVSAHGDLFIEFNPDSSDSLNILYSSDPIQIFLPQNEFLGGMDFWVDNSGSQGLATFELRDANNVVVASKTLNIPTILDTSGGQRLHIDFDNQIWVANNQNYSMKIISALPDLNIYYANRINLISHNAPYISQYINGVANVGGIVQDYSFKFALYEGSEVSPPVISNANVINTSANESVISFSANEPVDFKAKYGLSGQGFTQTTSYVGGYTYCGSGINLCSLPIYVLPNTNYDYMLFVRDTWGNEATFSGAFVSFDSGLPAPSASLTGSPSASPTPTSSDDEDVTPPVISNAQVADVTYNSVEIAWTTDEAADSDIIISFTKELITVAANSDSTFELEHLLSSGPTLAPGKTYIATIISRDISDNESQTTINFTTLAETPTPTPPVKSTAESDTPTPTPTDSQTSGGGDGIKIISDPDNEGSVTISWSPSSGGGFDGYRVDVFDADNNLVHSSETPVDSNSVNISNLNKGKYTVIVYEKDGDVFRKAVDPIEFYVGNPFIERLSTYLPYMLIVLTLLIFAGWKIGLFGKKE